MEVLDGFLGAVRTMLSKGKARVLGQKPHNQPPAGDGQPMSFDFEFLVDERDDGRPYPIRRIQQGGDGDVRTIE